MRGCWEDLDAAALLPFHDSVYTLSEHARRLYDACTDQQKMDRAIDDLSKEWACLLLGYRYGTGELSMYGAFTVDLDARTIVDDRNADPVVENIRIAT